MVRTRGNGKRGGASRNRGKQTGGRKPQGSYYRPRGGRRGGFRSAQSDRFSNVVPPSSLSQGSVGRSVRKEITIRQVFSATDIAKYSTVQQSWAGSVVNTKNCVTRILYNKSDLAVDMTTPAAPVAVTSKKTITHLSRITAQANSTIAQMILATGKKIFNESSAMQRNVGVRQVENRPKVDMIRTPKMPVPARAVMVGKKGHKLYSITLPQFPGLTFDYALAADVLTATGEHDQTTGYIGLMDVTVGVHSLPNSSYVPSTSVLEIPDIILERDNDPSAVMKGYVPSSGETTVKVAARKVLDLKSSAPGRFTLTTDLESLVPRPKPGTLFALTQAVSIMRSRNEITQMELAFVERDVQQISFYESMEAFLRGYNTGSVTDTKITVLPGNVLMPRRLPPTLKTHLFLNGENEPFTPGDAVLQIVRRHPDGAGDYRQIHEYDEQPAFEQDQESVEDDGGGSLSDGSLMMDRMSVLSIDTTKSKIDKINKEKKMKMRMF